MNDIQVIVKAVHIQTKSVTDQAIASAGEHVTLLLTSAGKKNDATGAKRGKSFGGSKRGKSYDYHMTVPASDLR